MSEETPAAPAPKAASAETSTPTTPAPEAAPATPAEQPAQPAETAPAESVSYFTKEQLAEMETFYRNNGGYDKVFGVTKKAISTPQSVTQPETPQQAPESQPTQQPVEQPQAPQNAAQSVREGSYSLEELAAQQYFDRLAGEEKYANIADEIRKGEVLKGLKEFNIEPVANGRVNDKDIRRYLDLYAASKPAKPTSATPVENQVDYVATTDGKVTSMDEANKIQLQSIQLRKAGQPPHPLEEAAKAFVKEYYSKGLDKKR